MRSELNRRSFIQAVSTLSALPVIGAVADPARTEDVPAYSPSHAASINAPETRWIDLSQAQPSVSLSKTPQHGRWRTVAWKARYEGQDRQGTMLMVGPETDAPEVAIDPQLSGPHEIFVGLPTGWGVTSNPVKIRMDDDPCHVLMLCDRAAVGKGIQDAYFRTVDMSGRRIHIAQFNEVDPGAAGIAYIRAVPVPAPKLKQDARRGLRLVALNDGHGLFFMRRPPIAESQIWEEILPYRDSGFSALQFCITGADHCNYPTKVGTLLGEGLSDFPEIGDRYYYENVSALFRRGIDPVASVVKFCRSIGIECHLAVRMEAFALEAPYDGFFMSRFYAAHPELRCVDRDGRTIARLSYAHPEVREHIYQIVDELVRHEPDGINLIYCRGIPLVLYEAPFVKEFQVRHGRDPRQLAEDHPDVLALRAEIMNDFMRELRRRTRRPSGEPIEMSAIVLSDAASNRFYGLDVLRWVKERWVDEISPSVWNAQRKPVPIECAYLAGACKASGCRLIVNVLPRRVTPADYISEAKAYRAQGAEGFSFWDINGHHYRPVEWKLFNAIGHLDELKNPPSAQPAVLTVTELGGFVMDRYPAGWGF